MSNAFERNIHYNRLTESYTEEYLNILAILYGDQLESGEKRIKDFKNMTMRDAGEELRIRTIMLRARFTQKQCSLREKYAEDERAMMEELKRAGQ